MMREKYREYVERIQFSHASLILTNSASELGPTIRPTANYGPVPWKLDWAILFEDRNYIRITENYRQLPKSERALGGERDHFSFHYGTHPGTVDAAGFPIRLPNDPNTKLRIDLDAIGPHLHYRGEDHIPQHRVEGFKVADADMFQFVNAILKHRSSGTDLHEILGFTVKAAE